MKFLAALLLIVLAGCNDRSAPPKDWETWSVWVEARYPVSDAQGHSPDIGSDEWARALQQKLGVIDEQGHGPDIGSAEWRAAVESKVCGPKAP
ncbi:MAG: hypothetical protein ACKOKC_09520 [Chthoniobacterales bacterium]